MLVDALRALGWAIFTGLNVWSLWILVRSFMGKPDRINLQLIIAGVSIFLWFVLDRL